MRQERDFLGEVTLPDDYPFGIHTHRAASNFAFSDETIDPDLFFALIQVKKAAAIANAAAGLISPQIGDFLCRACDEIVPNISAFIPPIHPLQGGAGTSTNMAANELIANIALRLMGKTFGQYHFISPLDHVNLSQSTNDAYPTALKIAILRGLKKLHANTEELLNVLQEKEKEFAHILKIGRTELQDAMPLSLGQEFSAWAEAISRFRWRLDKAIDWVREVNISGTAIGTSINADRRYSRTVIEALREIVNEPLSLSRNLVDATQNLDPIVEVSGLIRTGAVSIKKIAFDLRLLSSGPQSGFGELILPPLQAGSSIMPGKVNPVMPEAAEQVCLMVIGGDSIIASAASQSNLELPQFLPLIAHVILHNIRILTNLLPQFSSTLSKIVPNLERIRKHVDSSAAVATLLTPTLGYDVVADLVAEAYRTHQDVLNLIRSRNLIEPPLLERLLSPSVMASPGLPVLDDSPSPASETTPGGN